MYSKSINKLIDELKKLPSVGQHTAERYVFHWLKSGKNEVAELKNALDGLLNNTKSCKICWNFADNDPCDICSSTNRNHSQICIVAEAQGVAALESTKAYNGIYHVLRGTIDTETEDETKIKELIIRIEKDKNIKEIILALNPDMPGETTMLFLKEKIKNLSPEIKVTRLARGLPMGSDLQYADEITLEGALKNRS